MGSKGKVYITDTTTAADPVAFTLAQAASIFTRITNYYATETERNTETAVPSKMSAAEKLGMKCWVDSRKGFCFWDGTAWSWEPQMNVLFNGSRASAADALGTGASLSIILMPTITLPPGNRLIEISASSNITNLAPSNTTTIAAFANAITTGRAYVGGIADGDNYLQAVLMGSSTESVTFYRKYIRSGTIDFDLRGLSGTAGNPVRFTNSWLQVVDLGPA